MEKVCRTCDESKPLTDYHRDKASSDGHRHECKACAYERKTQWTKDNRDRAREYKATWEKANPERVRAYNRARDPKKAREYRRKSYWADIEKSRAEGRARYWADVEKRRAQARARYARKKKISGSLKNGDDES